MAYSKLEKMTPTFQTEPLNCRLPLRRPFILTTPIDAHTVLRGMKQIHEAIAEDYRGKTGTEADDWKALGAGVSKVCDALLEMTNEATNLSSVQAKRIENLILNAASETHRDVLEHHVTLTLILLPLATYINSCVVRKVVPG